MKYPIPDEALAQHTAVLGKTGSGKTSTGKTIIEHLVGQGARVCILDPIKSDWWGLTSSANGKKEGLPFYILGGPRGHVPLHSSSGKVLAEIVADGHLPLSILDMADFAPGGQSKFFIDFAQTLLRKMQGVVHLVLEESHLFAPKERSGIGDENMAIHWAKMLATAGRSKGIRLILLTQRTQALHNALLGSCETMIAHRLTAPADQKPLNDWLKSNVQKDIAEQVSSTLSSLKTGTAWVCSGEAKFFEQVAFPRIKTYDNSATPSAGEKRKEVKTAFVDVEKLRSIVGEAEADFKANDPKLLKAEIARLKKGLAKKGPSSTDVEKIRKEAFEAGADSIRVIWRQSMDKQMAELTKEIRSRYAVASFGPIKTQPIIQFPTKELQKLEKAEGALERPLQKIVDAMNWWLCFAVKPTQNQIAFLAGYSPKSGTWSTYMSRLRSMGLVNGTMLTEEGMKLANPPSEDPSGDALRAAVLAKLDKPLVKILTPIIDHYPEGVSQDRIAGIAGYSPNSGTWSTYLSRLRSLDLIEGRGALKAQDWLFP